MRYFVKKQYFLNKFQEIIWEAMSVKIFKNKVKKRFGNIIRLKILKKYLKRPKPLFFKVEVMYVYRSKKKMKELMRIHYERLKFLFYYNKLKQSLIKKYLINLKSFQGSLFKNFLLNFECRLDIILFKLGLIFNDFYTTKLFSQNSFCFLNGIKIFNTKVNLEIGDEISFSYYWYLYIKSLYYKRFNKFYYYMKNEKKNQLVFFDFFLKFPKFIEFSFELFEFILVNFPTKYDIFSLVKLNFTKLLTLFNYLF